MESGLLKIGDCLLDLGRHRVVRNGQLAHLEPRDFEVLVQLVDNAPNLVTSRALLRVAWRSKVVGDNVLHQSVGRLRRLLGDDAKNPTYIQTLPRLGYQVIAPVTRVAAATKPHLELSPLAVLPFRDYSASQNSPYLIDGLSFELSHQLMQIGTQVISLDRGARAHRIGMGDVEVGARLGAKTVLHGSLMVADGRVRVAAMLSNVDFERHIWTAKYDHRLDQIFDLHTVVSEEIVQNIVEYFMPDECTLRFDPLPPKSADAVHVKATGSATLNLPSRDSELGSVASGAD